LPVLARVALVTALAGSRLIYRYFSPLGGIGSSKIDCE
jgi:hypothetical protein